MQVLDIHHFEANQNDKKVLFQALDQNLPTPQETQKKLKEMNQVIAFALIVLPATTEIFFPL